MKSPRSLLFLTGFFTASLIASNLLGSRLLEIAGFTVSLGLFIFPFTFLSADIMTELYGKETALSVIKQGLLLQLYILLFVGLGLVLPGSPLRNTDDAYHFLFGITPRMVLASITAYAVSQFLDVKIFSALKTSSLKNSLLIRTNLASWISQFFDSLIFCFIFLGGVLPWNEWIKTLLVSYFTKILVATFDSPFVKFGVTWIRKKETFYDSAD